MMVKKPDNTYDPNAVAVQTLHGQDLGYVPREHTASFPHDVTFGHVYSLGQNAKGLWGATVGLYSIPSWHCTPLSQFSAKSHSCFCPSNSAQ